MLPLIAYTDPEPRQRFQSSSSLLAVVFRT